MILACNCKNEYQDKRYGKGKRVMNAIGAKRLPNTHRCTCCEKERAKG